MILCIGLTPTVQRTMFFDRFETGAVNRARETLTTASGKGANVARVLTTLGAPATLVQPLGGASGRYIAATLENEGVSQEIVWVEDDAPTRTCTTLLVKDGPTTELVEEARPVSPSDARKLEDACLLLLETAQAVCCSGSLPKGIDEGIYARVVAEAQRRNVPVFVDAQKRPLHLALAERPYLVKPNREEASATLGFSLTGEPLTDAQTAVSALLEAGATWALVSMGRSGSLLGGRESDQRYQIFPPTIDAINPIGSGDSLTAGTAYAHFVLGKPMPEAVVYGTATAAANCLTPTSGVVHVADVTHLLGEVQMDRQ